MSNITIRQLLESNSALKELAAMPLRPVVAHRVAKAIRFITDELEDFEVARAALLQRFAVKDGDGKMVYAEKDDAGNPVAPGVMVRLTDGPAFHVEHSALMAETVEIPTSVKPIKISELDAPVTARLLAPLDWLFADE